MSNRTSKLKHELLIPGDTSWELWSSTSLGAMEHVRSFDDSRPGSFATTAARRTLALPAASVWVLPAWLKGEREHLRDMANLHLERLSVRTPGHEQAMIVNSIDESAGSHLTRVVALKDVTTPLAELKLLPDDCQLSAMCFALAPNSITIWRELGRLVVAITVGPQLAYFSPMSASSLDQSGLAELNNICLQLTFQKVLESLSGIVLWMEDGDVERIHKMTGLEVRRDSRPGPRLIAGQQTGLMPMDVIAARQAQQASARHRMVALSAGFVIAVFVAAFSALMSIATSERDALREKIAEITPRASRVAGHRAAWMEAAPAVDPTQFPMQVLLNCMEPKSPELALMSFECTPDRVLIQGHTPSVEEALKYQQDIKDSENLTAFIWEAGVPKINERDNSATFELKGMLASAEVTKP
ncbi:MAG: hypothetical protein JNM99_03060 [Verrucomicrobiaceae bacterium]|nr:hypothetical protein [Verrucomicrobiaceae bacterium]